MQAHTSYLIFVLTVFNFCGDKTVLGKNYHYPEKYYRNYICLKSEKGVDYRGTVSHTINTFKKGGVLVSKSGKPCIPWHKCDGKESHAANQENSTNAELVRAECRNPGGHGKTVWCYTDTVKARDEGKPYWGYCKVPICTLEFSGFNIAEGKMAWQSSTYLPDPKNLKIKQSAHLATNGIMSNVWGHGEQCSTTDNDKLSWILIDLEAHFSIAKVVILNRKYRDEYIKESTGRLGHFKVSVGNVFFNSTHHADFVDLVPHYYTLCKFVDSNVDNGAKKVVTCNMREGRYPVGRYVVLAENHIKMTICQLQVFGKFAGHNIAKGKQAYQAQTYAQQAESLATNGIINSRFRWTEPKRCAVSTAVNNLNWFAVSLQDFQKFPYPKVVNYIIEDVLLLNMGDKKTAICNDGDACKGHLKLFEVSVGKDFFKRNLQYPNPRVEKIFGYGLVPSRFKRCTKPNSDLEVRPGEDAIVDCNGAHGRYVVVATRRKYLTICQIQVLGVMEKDV